MNILELNLTTSTFKLNYYQLFTSDSPLIHVNSHFFTARLSPVESKQSIQTRYDSSNQAAAAAASAIRGYIEQLCRTYGTYCCYNHFIPIRLS